MLLYRGDGLQVIARSNQWSWLHLESQPFRAPVATAAALLSGLLSIAAALVLWKALVNLCHKELLCAFTFALTGARCCWRCSLVCLTVIPVDTHTHTPLRISFWV